MSSSSKGKAAERRAKTIVGSNLGFKLVAEAKVTPVWHQGSIVGNQGNIDLLEGAVDHVWIKRGRRTLFVQVTYVGNESPRRKKLREAGFDPAFHEVWLMSFDPAERNGTFRVFRDCDDYLEKGHRLTPEDFRIPWEQPTVQAALA